MTGSPLEATARLARVFEELSVRYALVGSVASSLQGVPRATADADLIADLPEDRVGVLVRLLEEEFYIDEAAVREALARTSMFNVVHLGTGYKVDVYLTGGEPFQQSRLARRKPVRILGEEGAEVYVATPEDVILGKLAWFRLGKETSTRQFIDVLGVLRLQGDRMDLEYLQRWADVLEVGDLLERAFQEAERGT